jgi:hypothetical protein
MEKLSFACRSGVLRHWRDGKGAYWPVSASRGERRGQWTGAAFMFAAFWVLGICLPGRAMAQGSLGSFQPVIRPYAPAHNNRAPALLHITATIVRVAIAPLPEIRSDKDVWIEFPPAQFEMFVNSQSLPQAGAAVLKTTTVVFR